jgi:hypothetical protein
LALNIFDKVFLYFSFAIFEISIVGFLDADVPLNYLKWQFILPLLDNLSPIPSNVIDYLCLAEVTVDTDT